MTSLCVHFQDDGAEFVELCKQINSSSPQPCDLDEALLQELAYGARGDLCPMAAFIGGITAQEVMKVQSEIDKWSQILNILK